MITGFNTDIIFQGVTYHVQTEDKGVETPLILSLVYDRGTILASKRSPYDDLLKSEFSEKELADRLQRQHKLICAAVRAGRIEDLKQMTLKESAAKRQGQAAKESKAVPAESPQAKPKQVVKAEKKSDEMPAPQLLNVSNVPLENGRAAVPPPRGITGDLKARAAETEILEIPISILEDLIIEEVEIIEEESIVLSAEAVEIIAEAPKEDSPSQKEAAAAGELVDQTLNIELLNEVSFKSGERKTLSVLVKRGEDSENGLSGAHVMVKILGTSFRPQVFHAKTDSNGVAIVNLQLPRFTRGRAAVLVRAMSDGEETELRRVISQD